ncbi:hypothetical protein H5410_060604 [Solanum commersonii]|uniref:DUF4283 domain-containing protein n=1 Tax=Solanum commersonii TaxID=4109 RepID=A0A9J5W724_SOLCO|nr:hypothetical protein H5410_060604 [Solanum commersonii]
MAASPFPQPLAVGKTNVNLNTKAPYAAIQNPEEGLHQVVIIKFAYGKPVLSKLRKLLPKQFDVKGNCNIGQLDFRHLLIRFDLCEDFRKHLKPGYGYRCQSYLQISLRGGPYYRLRQQQESLLWWIKQHKIEPGQKESGKIIEHYQKIVYDNLPLYCTHCKHQGHEENKCRLLMRKTMSQGDRLGVTSGNQIAKPTEIRTSELNVSVVATTENQILVPSREMVQHQMDVSSGYNNQQGMAIGEIVYHVQEHNSETIAKALVIASQGDSGQQLNGNDVGDQSITDARLNIEITATSKSIDWQAEKIPIEKRMHLEIGLWYSRIGSSTSRSNSSSQEKGATKCVDPNLTLPTQNAFEPLSATRKIQLEHCMEKEEQVSPPPLNSKLSPKAPIFVPKSVIAKNNESGALSIMN